MHCRSRVQWVTTRAASFCTERVHTNFMRQTAGLVQAIQCKHLVCEELSSLRLAVGAGAISVG
jgi:hypothetical protein